MGKAMRPGSIEYDPVLADEILERLADGDSLASICCDEEMPDERSVRRWARNHGDFGAKYAVARRLGYEKRADKLLEIADDSSADWIDTDDGHRVLNGAHVNRARLMIDTRKWLLFEDAAKGLRRSSYGRGRPGSADPSCSTDRLGLALGRRTRGDRGVLRSPHGGG